MIITQGMPIPDMLVKWSASLVKNAQISSLQQGVTLLCLIGEAGWWVDGWDIGIGIGIGRGGIANWKPCSLLLHLPSRRPPNWKCSQHPYFHTLLLLIPSVGRVKKMQNIFWANSIPYWKLQNCPQLEMRALPQVIDNPNSKVGADFEEKKRCYKQSFLPLLNGQVEEGWFGDLPSTNCLRKVFRV